MNCVNRYGFWLILKLIYCFSNGLTDCHLEKPDVSEMLSSMFSVLSHVKSHQSEFYHSVNPGYQNRLNMLILLIIIVWFHNPNSFPIQASFQKMEVVRLMRIHYINLMANESAYSILNAQVIIAECLSVGTTKWLRGMPEGQFCHSFIWQHVQKVGFLIWCLSWGV